MIAPWAPHIEDLIDKHHDPLKYLWEACSDEQEYGWGDPKIIANEPIDYHLKQDDSLDSDWMAHVTINLSATDKQIQKDFTHWLTHYRKANKYPSETRLFDQTQNKLDKLIEFQVIPYLDLLLVHRIRGDDKITDQKLGELLFPDEFSTEITARVRKVTKKIAEYVIKNQLHKTLSIQLARENIIKNKGDK